MAKRALRDNMFMAAATEQGTATFANVGLDFNAANEDTVVPAPDGGRGWLVVLAVFVIFAGIGSHQIFSAVSNNYANIIPQIGPPVPNATLPVIDPKKIMARLETFAGTLSTVYQGVLSAGGLVTILLVLKFGYRAVSMVGGILSAVGCLGAAFSDPTNLHLLSFFYAALPGLGHSMMMVCCLVAILEYFRKRRLIALVLANLGTIGAILAVTIGTIIYMQTWAIKTWRTFLLMQCGVACWVTLMTLLLKPLGRRVKDSTKTTLVSRIFNVHDLEVFKEWYLYTFIVMVFFWEAGYSVAMSKLPNFKGPSVIPKIPAAQLLVLILTATTLIGFLVMCCVPTKITLRTVVIVITALTGVVCFFNLFVNFLYDPVFATIYVVVVGVIRGISLPFLEFLVPLLLGEKNGAVGVGVVSFAVGVGGLSAPLISDKILLVTTNIDRCFYLVAAFHFLTCVFAVLSYRLKKRHQVAPNAEQGGNISAIAHCDVQEAHQEKGRYRRDRKRVKAKDPHFRRLLRQALGYWGPILSPGTPQGVTN